MAETLCPTLEKPFAMIRHAEKGERRLDLAGTAHFFPYSFRSDIIRHLRSADVVFMEGPLDTESMKKVAEAGKAAESEGHLFDHLRPATLSRLSRLLMPSCINRVPSFFLHLRCFRAVDPLYDMVRGMKPWLAFFTLWGAFLRGRGWHGSVDLEFFRVAAEMGKPVRFLETIEEQIEVLESLPVEKLAGFVEQARFWPEYADAYITHYLAGDVKSLLSITDGFPSRHWNVIERRDRILFERLLPHLEKGRILACVGAPHLAGIDLLLEENGFALHSVHESGR
jgi:hypothetical protein